MSGDYNFRARGARSSGPWGGRRRSRAFDLAVILAAIGLAVWSQAPAWLFARGLEASPPEQVAGDAPGAYYPNCTAARAAGAAPIYSGSPGYRPELDRDSDGIACEPYR